MFSEILAKIRENDIITIYPHVSPDGDALGSCFGLKELLVHMFPEKKIYVLGENCKFNEDRTTANLSSSVSQHVVVV